MVLFIVVIFSLQLLSAATGCSLSSCANFTSVSNDGTFEEINNCTVMRGNDGMMLPLIGYTGDGDMIICWNQTFAMPAMVNSCNVITTDSSYELPASTGLIVDSALIPFAMITFLTYAIFKSLRTLPGIILMNLEMAYILSHIIAIIYQSLQSSISRQEVPCTLSNTATFYATAAIGTWKNIFLQQTCWIFYKANKLQSASPNNFVKTIIIYCIIGWGLPLIATMAIFAVDFIDRRSFLYETDNCIHILDEPADGVGKLLAFIFIGLQNVYNIVLFLILIRFFFQALHDSDKEISKQSSIKTRLLKVSFALLVITGASWIFKLIGAYHNALWIIGIGITLKVIEQLLLFILFTITKTVLMLYMNITKTFLKRLKQFLT